VVFERIKSVKVNKKLVIICFNK